jgi:lysophospholipase L1-like esterase
MIARLVRLLAVSLWFFPCLAPDLAAQPLSRWILAEGAANAFFDEEVLIANPNATAADIRITFLSASGSPVEHTFTMPATSRRTVRVSTIPALAGVGAVSAVVECTNGLDIVVERSMYWAGGQRYAGHNSPGVLATATEWFLAEGSTGFFNTFILVVNPDPMQSANVEVTFLKPGGGTVERHVTIAPRQRFNLWVNAEVPELANSAFSTVVRSTNGVGLVVERAMYFGPGYKGGHESAAVAQPSTTWLFGEGFTGPGGSNPLQFDTFLLLANPNPGPVTVTVTFLREGAPPIQRMYGLPGRSRENVWTDLIPGLEAAAFSMNVSATLPIVAERAMYWGAGGWGEAHDTPGATAPFLSWAFAEGVEDGVDASGTFFDSYYLVSNPHATALDLRAAFLREDGTGVVRSYMVPAQSRFTLPAATIPELSNQRFGAVLSSTNGLPFIAERAVYWGPNLTGGHASVGTPWPGAIPTPPAPPPPTVAAIAPATGGTPGGTPVTVTGANFAQGATVRIGGVAATNVVVVNATTLRAVTGPRAAGAADVTVTSNGVPATLPGAFTYLVPPVVSSVSPNSGSTSGGTVVTITGANFAAGAVVRVGGVAASSVSVVNATTITAVTGARAAGTVDVEVVVGGVVGTLPGSFSYVPPLPFTSTDVSLAFGDSITFGTSSTIVNMGGSNMIAVTTITGYPQRLRSLMQARYTQQTISVTNSGSPGECASAACAGPSGQSRLGTVLAPSQDLVILLEGVNDINAGFAIGGIASALRQMVQAGKAGGRAVILCTLLPVKPDAVNGFLPSDPARIVALNEEIRLIAAQEGAVLVDAHAAFGGANVDGSLLSPDGLHPNDAGYQRLAQVLFDTIRVAFEQGSGS